MQRSIKAGRTAKAQTKPTSTKKKPSATRKTTKRNITTKRSKPQARINKPTAYTNQKNNNIIPAVVNFQRAAISSIQSSSSSLTSRRQQHSVQPFKSKTNLMTPLTQHPLFNQSKRGLFIQTHTTPNPRSLKFTPGKIVLGDREDGAPNTAYFDQNSRANARRQCQLAYTLLLLDGVMNVMLGADFVTVTTIDENPDWMVLKPMIYEAISEAYATDEPILKTIADLEPSREMSTLEGDEEAVSLIKEIIDLRIRPTVMDDGGDVEFIQFDKDRVVWLLMKGSCSGCPSSGATLKHGIQNMIMHYVPEVKSVEEWKDEAELVSDEVFQKLEAKLAAKNEPKENAEKH